MTCGGDIAGAEAQTRTMNVTIPSGNAGVKPTIKPSAAALNGAGFAYVLTWTDGGLGFTGSGGPAIPRSR